MAKDSNGKAERQLESVRGLASELADKLDLNASLRLWDGSRVPLGANVTGPFEISIAGPGVIGALLRRPTLDNFIRHYVEKDIDFSGGTLIDLGSQLNRGGRSVKLKGKEALRIAARLAPFLLARGDNAQNDQGFAGEITGRARKTADNKDYIQFHYDLSNEFYALFLDPEMVYSCAYYTDWENDIAQAQRDKLEMICRKLRLEAGERFLDIGCGWGGLICHAAKNYGVTAHGITLSEAQLDYAREKIRRLGLEDRVTVELKDYSAMEGQFDKIASIGMYEHIGLKNIPGYMQQDAGRCLRRTACSSTTRSRGARPSPAGSGARCGPSSGRSRSTSSLAASSTTSGIRSSPWSARASRSRTWRPGACTMRARASCGASG